jgi:hypothetical protein
MERLRQQLPIDDYKSMYPSQQPEQVKDDSDLLKLSLHTWLGDAQAANTKEIDKEEYTATQFVDTSTKTWGN